MAWQTVCQTWTFFPAAPVSRSRFTLLHLCRVKPKDLATLKTQTNIKTLHIALYKYFLYKLTCFILADPGMWQGIETSAVSYPHDQLWKLDPLLPRQFTWPTSCLFKITEQLCKTFLNCEGWQVDPHPVHMPLAMTKPEVASWRLLGTLHGSCCHHHKRALYLSGWVTIS